MSERDRRAPALPGKAFPQEDFDAAECAEIISRLKHLNKRRRFKPRLQQCFLNAWHYVGQEVFEYADGKATSIIPVEHAWNVFNGKVLDFTWREESDKAKWAPEKLLERARRNNETKAYWGIVVPLKELYRQRLAVGHRLYVEEPPDFPILKTGALPWEVSDE